MKYKVSVDLDEILKENEISQTTLISKSNLSHNFITKLIKHKEVANLDKIATIINTLNDEGCNIRPSDLIKFTPIDATQIKIIASQHRNNVFWFFFKLKYQELRYLDLIKLTIQQQGKQLYIRTEANDTQLYKLDKAMQKAIQAQSFTLGHGIERLVQLPSYEKRTATQMLAEEVINQALAAKLITSKPNYKVSVDYFDLFEITFNNVNQQDSQITFAKDKDDSLILLDPNAYQATYPFMHPASTGRVTKGETFTKPKPHELTEEEKNRLDELIAIFAKSTNQHK
ncbi:hypothetical protein BHL85_10875 [Limosilactobacillus reuteri]|uniref:helix-turn-helix domain-containing protein n=1 Tax=Limosilactobacillus reuteri TaxID=1598 RepID=UPI000A2E16B3|nr:helix-turn-helix transcriptional regulator [Limosilactobacillus reuteri]OTA43033.1 hypothetical protein BHL89_10125 [Limosilactobacillus reuteri]OTA53028.1 hypothetical protein BHL85_10875 [Limosilactobacillus reuteri]